ncbi:MAG: zinc-binding dehydrogenase [Anaerolineae bacterium]|nr:zinc-binding dehydrogenase [Anaerolineae bacterium]
MVLSARAAVMVCPGRIEIQEFPLPEVEHGAILLRVEMCGICGTDKHTWRGETKQYAGTPAESDTPYPIIPGHEIIGEVVEVNDRAGPRLDFDGEPVRVGDRLALCPDVVCGTCYACRHTFAYPWCENLKGYGNAFTCAEPPHLMGGWAEYLYVLPNAFVYHVPEALPTKVAVMAELMAVSYNLDKLKEFSTLSGEGLATGDTVVIQGAGPMGICHIIKARMLGAGDIIATDLSDDRLFLAEAFGADHTLNVAETTEQDRIAFVRALTHGRGADVVVECVGKAEVLVEGLEMLRKGGTYVEAGNFVETGSVAISPHRHLCAKNVRLIGMTNHPFTGYTPSLQMMQRTAHLFPYDRFVTHVYPLAQTEEALLRSMQPDTLKVVIAP